MRKNKEKVILTKKQKFQRFLKGTSKVLTGFVCFGGALVLCYTLTPNRVRKLSTKFGEETFVETNFDKFVQKLTKDAGMNEEEESTATYLSASFENLDLSYTVEGSDALNHVTIDGGLDFRMHELAISGVELNLHTDINYNGKNISVTLGHFKNQLYFNLNDTLKLKCSNLSRQEIGLILGPIFAQEGHLKFQSMFRDFTEKFTVKINDMIDGLISGDNSSSSLDLGGFSTSEEKTDLGYTFNLSVGEDISINLLSDDNFSLYRVEIEKCKFSTVNLSGAINVQLKNYDSFVAPSENDEEYVEILNYSGLYGKLAALLSEENQKIGVQFAADLDGVSSKNTDVDVARIEGSVNVDFNELLDLEDYMFDLDAIDPTPVNSIKRNGDTNEQEAEESILDKIIDKCGFNLQLDLIGQQDKEYANLDLSFVGGEGYLRFNEQVDSTTKAKKSVMKLKFDVETMNKIMEKIPSLINGISGEKSSKSNVNKLLDFLSDDLANAIKEGDYSFVIDMLEDISNDSTGLNVKLDLSSLGIGDNASVGIKLDGTVDENTKVPAISLDVKNVAFGDYTLNADINTSEFHDVDMGDANEYQSVQFLPDVIDQVSDLVNSPKAGFVVNGSVLKDSDGTGISFSGAGKFDNSDEVKAGYGNMEIKQYKYHANKVWATHLLNVDIENKESNINKWTDEEGNEHRYNQNNALFIYGDPNSSRNVKGKVELQTFVDLVDIFTTFYGESKNNPKYTKFLAPITEMLGVSALGDIIGERDFLRLASNELLQEVSILDGGAGIKVVIGGTLLGLDSDMTIKVNFDGNNESGNQKIKSIEIIDFKMGSGDDVKSINLTFELKDYEFTSYKDADGNDRTLVNEIANRRNENYMNLNGIKTLLSLGINTTKLNYYHLTASANFSATVIGIDIPIDLQGIDFHVYVNGINVKVYGSIGSLPLVIYASEDYTLLSDKTMSAEFSFETYDDEENPDDEIGGIFNIKRKVTNPESDTEMYIDHYSSVFGIQIPIYGTRTKVYDDVTYYHYQCDSKNFLDNIVYYLLGGLVGIKSNLCESILGSESSSSETEAADFTQAFTSTGFSCEGNTINLGLNLDVLTGVSALKEAEITLKGSAVPTGEEDETMDVLTYLKASMRIHYAVDMHLTLIAQMTECVFDQDDAEDMWNLNANEKFVNLTSTKLDSDHFNQPTNPLVTKVEENVTYKY